MKRQFNLLSLSLSFAFLLSPIAAFSATSFLDDRLLPFNEAAVVIDGASGLPIATDFRNDLQTFVDDHDATIAFDVVDGDLAAEHTHLAIATGSDASDNQVAQWLAGTKNPQPFDPQKTRTTTSFSRLDSDDVRGIYYLNGPSDIKGKFVDLAHEHGYTTVPTDDGSLLATIPTPVKLTALIIGLLTFILAGLHAILGSRRYAIHSVHGLPHSFSIVGDWRSSVPAIAGTATVVSAGTTFFLHGYNGFAQWQLYSANVFIFAGLGVLCAVTGYLAAFVVITRTNVLSALKGNLVSRPLSFSTHGIRIVALFFGLVSIASLVMFIQETNRHAEYSQEWAKRSDVFSALVSGGIGDDMKQLGPELRRLDHEQKLLFINSFWQSSLEFSTTGRILVNQEFARQETPISEEVLSDAAKKNETIIYLPAAADAAVVTEIREGLAGEAEFAESTDYDPAQRTRVEYHKQPFTVFDYFNPGGSLTKSPLLHSPELVILPPGLQPLSDHNISATLTRTEILFTDHGAVEQLRNESPAGKYVLASRPMIDYWGKSNKSLYSDLRNTTFSTLVAIFIIIIAAISSTVLFFNRRHHQLRVYEILGYPVVRKFRGLIITELFYVFAIAIWLIHRYFSYQDYLAINTPMSWILRLEAPSIFTALSVFAIPVCTTLTVFFTIIARERTHIRHRT